MDENITKLKQNVKVFKDLHEFKYRAKKKLNSIRHKMTWEKSKEQCFYSRRVTNVKNYL